MFDSWEKLYEGLNVLPLVSQAWEQKWLRTMVQLVMVRDKLCCC